MQPLGLCSPAIFRNDRAYRHFYRIWQDMNLGIAAVFGDFLSMPLARTISCMSSGASSDSPVRGSMSSGQPASMCKSYSSKCESGGVTIPNRAVTVQVGSGWKLCFKKQYREFWVDPDGEWVIQSPHGSRCRACD